jgi:hypothetical protein
MRLPNLSPAIDRRIPGAAPAGPVRGGVQPQQKHSCGGACSPTNPCLYPSECQCQNGTCVPQSGGGGGGG